MALCTHRSQIRDEAEGGGRDSSKNKHATAHFRDTKHPIIRTLQPGERWMWCYLDETMLD